MPEGIFVVQGYTSLAGLQGYSAGPRSNVVELET